MLSEEQITLALNRVAGAQRGVAEDARKMLLAHERARITQIEELQAEATFIRQTGCEIGYPEVTAALDRILSLARTALHDEKEPA